MKIINVLEYLESLDKQGLNGNQIMELTGIHPTQRKRWIAGNKNPLIIDGVLYTAAEQHKDGKTNSKIQKLIQQLEA